MSLNTIAAMLKAQMDRTGVAVGLRYRHYKTGHAYSVEGLSVDEATLGVRVSYRRADGSCPVVWNRTLEDFTSTVDSPNGEGLVKRFQLDEPLAVELAARDALKDELLELHEGRWAVIKGNVLLGSWPTFEDALGAGYEAFGVTHFLVWQVARDERVHNL